MKRITAKKFKAATGVAPEQDDLERCNCKRAGEPAHSMCGWDDVRDLPFFWPKISMERMKEVFDEMRRRQTGFKSN